MAALTDKGFIRPTYADLLEEQQRRAKELFGDDIDTADTSVLGKFMRITVYQLAALYEELEGAYYARFPGYADGVNLDRLTPFAGITRNPAVAAMHLVRFLGDAGTSIPAGFRVATSDGVMFRTERLITIGDGGFVDEEVRCTLTGTVGNVPAGSITVVVNPVAQVTGIEQLEQTVEGRAAESDAELRVRFDAAIAGVGSATADAIRAAVLRVAGVTGCVVEENDTNATDARGIPAHSFEAYVLGDAAADLDIAAAIFAKKPIGIHAFGSTEISVQDSAGNEHLVRFSRVGEMGIQIKISIKNNSLYPAGGDDQLIDALAAYINALANGTDLVYSSLYPVIYTVPGVVEVSDIEISADGGATWTRGNVTVPPETAVRVQRGDIALEVSVYADQ